MASASTSTSSAPAVSGRVADGPSLRLNLRKRQAQPLSAGQSSMSSFSSSSAKPTTAIDPHGVESSGTKNVVVLGGSYGGMHAASVLAQKLPPSHRVILIERNSHFNHLYVFPRFSVLPGHEHKAFIPYTSIFGTAPKRRSTAKVATQQKQQRGRKDRDLEKSVGSSSQGILEMGGDARPSPTQAQELVSDANGEAASPSDEEGSWASDSSGRKGAGSTRDSLFSARSSSTTSTSPTAFTDEASADNDPGNKAMEGALLADGEKHARAEEHLGRPPLEVTELGDAMDKGLDLTGEQNDALEDAGLPSSPSENASDEEADQGFEDSAPHVVLQASVTNITDSHVVVTPAADESSGKAASSKLWSIDSLSIPYTHLIYALGSHLPDPLRTVARTKPQGMHWMSDVQNQIKNSERIVLVGGGALGVEFATDIKSVYPDKDVTLIHSRQRLLPNFDERIHEIAKARMEELGVKLVLGERLALTEGCPQGSTTALDPDPEHEASQDASRPKPIRRPSDALHSGLKRVRTTGGKEFICDLLMLCTGQQPNSGLMASLSPSSVDSHTRLVRVQPTLQVALPPPEEAVPGPFDARPPCGDCDCFLDKKAAGSQLDERQERHLDDHGRDSEEAASRQGRIPNVYAIGDVADAFGSLNAGYQAWNMADVAAENIVRDIGIASTDNSAATVDDKRSPSPSTKVQPVEMLTFTPAPNMLKLSLGLGKMVSQGGPVTDKDENGNERTRPEISVKEDPHDLGVVGVWQFMAGAPTEDLYK
ncbi:FAD/NAD(P)-binding domain-containing protein [Microstroma glucosiphilum]|uniref:FAD/NAD(P)-binding domain-containing protein n=1 Tax=Pseudomicrostroma glucosiphilum TaxID=1684307 RepID=A0A316U8R6_9BASI|nr:FAD/NAD(P)-binding domain-containing protein [Pseudomicrostroma glucosiphilum]PWN21569.1 FAD/NAD(P)-binding domain-containing protein [Pseudomicrostroma glucosiphilum]